MSAIAGVLYLDGRSASVEAITRMLAALAHRGADAASHWSEGPVSLGHRMRYTTPESLSETQPVVLEDAGLVLVADARIDNRHDLGAALGIGRLSAVSDSALILRAYEKWGRDCASHLIGDFAFVVWDRRARTIFCARDPMGVKPFYYHCSARIFAFSTEVKALLRLPEVPREIDELQLAAVIAAEQNERERTIYRGIERLPAAHCLAVDASGARMSRHWNPEAASEVRFSTGEQYVEAFREIFQEAVRCRVRSAYHVGSTLSGGLDSSSITCVARDLRLRQGAPALHTFSLVFPGLPESDLRLIDERRYISSVVRGGGLQPHCIEADRSSPLDDVERVLWHLDEPFASPNLYLHWAMFRAAQASGARVLLDGFDGDSVVSHGFGRLNSLLRRGEWDTFEAEIRAFAAQRDRDPGFVLPHYGLPYLSDLARRGRMIAWLRAAGELTRRFPLSRRQLVLDHGLHPLVPERLLGAWRRLRADGASTTRLLRRRIARDLARDASARSRGAAKRGILRERDSHVLGLMQPLYQRTLEIADKSAAAFGVEPRYPFFDRRLIEFCLGVPEEQKLARGWGRLIFRQAMEGILPPEVQWRSDKGNLGPNFYRRLRTADRPRIESVDGGRMAHLVDPRVLDDARRRLLDGPERGWSDPEATQMFRVAVVDAWLGARGERGGNTVADDQAMSPAA